MPNTFTHEQATLCFLMALLDTHIPDEYNVPNKQFLCVGVCPGCGLWQVEYVALHDGYGTLNMPNYLWTAELVQDHRVECEPFNMLAGLAVTSTSIAGSGQTDFLGHLRDLPHPAPVG